MVSCPKYLGRVKGVGGSCVRHEREKEAEKRVINVN